MYCIKALDIICYSENLLGGNNRFDVLRLWSGPDHCDTGGVQAVSLS